MEGNSYGFRPGRGCHDAIEAIFLSIKQKSKWVLDADIAKCLDKIDHKALMEKLNTTSPIRKQIRAWLKAGVIEKKEWYATEEGTGRSHITITSEYSSTWTRRSGNGTRRNTKRKIQTDSSQICR